MKQCINILCVISLIGFMSCYTKQITQKDPQEQQSDHPEASASPIDENKQSQENQNVNLVQSCFRNQPPWVTTSNYSIHGNKTLTIHIDIENTKVFSQIKRPSDDQMRALKQRCFDKNYELIDYFWYGDREINQLFGLCLEKKDHVQYLQ